MRILHSLSSFVQSTSTHSTRRSTESVSMLRTEPDPPDPLSPRYRRPLLFHRYITQQAIKLNYATSPFLETLLNFLHAITLSEMIILIGIPGFLISHQYRSYASCTPGNGAIIYPLREGPASLISRVCSTERTNEKGLPAITSLALTCHQEI